MTVVCDSWLAAGRTHPSASSNMPIASPQSSLLQIQFFIACVGQPGFIAWPVIGI